MASPKIKKEDVGEYVIDELDGKIYKIASFTNRPTFEVQPVEGGKRISFVVGDVATEKFTKLIREDKE